MEESANNAKWEQLRVGLCVSCEHVRRVTSDRGSVFYRCARAESDAAYRKYPALPVVMCAGYERKSE